jgi:hypothetical protein
MGKKDDKSLILRHLGEKMRFLGKEATFYVDRKTKFRILCGFNLIIGRIVSYQLSNL